MEVSRTLSEVLTVEDIRTLEKAAASEDPIRFLASIIMRLPAPRVYTCEALWQTKSPVHPIWDIGRDILSVGLTIGGLSVIDPDTIRDISGFNRSLRIRSAKEQNPFLLQLIEAEFLDEIYLPDDEMDGPIRKRICAAAKRKQVTIHIWKPEQTD